MKRQSILQVLAMLAFLLSAVGSDSRLCADDRVEFLNGTTLQGTILEIRKAKKEFDFETSIAGQSVARTYKYPAVHAVTFKGKRFVINEMADAPSELEHDQSGERVEKSEAEVRQIIDTVGASQPDWLESTAMNHPKSLDLKWPLKAEGRWNESKNIGQYLWGRVNPNPARWRPSVKLLYECIRLHAGQPTLLKRDYKELGDKYFELFQDYARAAYWYEKARADVDNPSGIHLAECYYQLGNKKMAMDRMRGKTLHVDAVKLLGVMGEVEHALEVTKFYSRTPAFNEAFLNAGDALRSAGRLDEAIAYYQKILDRNQARDATYLKRYRGRASDSTV